MEKQTLFEREVFERFVKNCEVTEARAMGLYGANPAWGGEYARGIVAGYFDDPEKFKTAVAALDKLKHGGIYFTLQVIDPRLLGRAFNRLGVLKETTSDRDVLAYRFLYVDLDPRRPAGISSSDTELAAALKLRDEIAGEIQSKYSLPAPIRAVSGNGGHLLYPLPDLPAAKYGPVVKRMLEEISTTFSTDAVSVDSKNFNPARICKLYGTTARKGDAVPAGPNREARPYRQAFIDVLPQGVLR
jgi:hypothetical protein